MAKIKHVAITCQDPDAVAKFYKEGFDLVEVARNDRQVQLSDGDINLTILKWKTNDDADVGPNGENYDGIHHIGFQVDDAADMDMRLKEADAHPMDDVNEALHGGMDAPQQGHGRNVETKYGGPDGVMIDISQGGWVGTGPE